MIVRSPKRYWYAPKGYEYRGKGRVWDFGFELNKAQREFIREYVMTGNLKESLAKAAYQSEAVIKDKEVQRCLREMLTERGIDQLLYTGIKQRLLDPESKNWQPTADYVSKIRGDFAPEKVVQISLSSEERTKRYQEILTLVGVEQDNPVDGDADENQIQPEGI